LLVENLKRCVVIVDGLSGNHRFFYFALGGFYTFMISFIEVLSLLALIATFAFLSRRNLLKLPRFTMKELAGWPTKDANLILIMEIVLVTCIFTMNTTDEILYRIGGSHVDHANGSFGFLISNCIADMLMPLFKDGYPTSALEVLERIGWWGHIAMVFAFLNYLPYSKHFHIVLAFPNTYFSNLEKKGRFTNMESVTNEVKLMMDPNADPYAAPADPNATPQRFGAKDVTDLTWKNLLDAYTCTECGRCTS
jgi:hypothetical protein